MNFWGVTALPLQLDDPAWGTGVKSKVEGKQRSHFKVYVALPNQANYILGGSSHLVSGLVHPNYKWINPLLIPCKSLGL